MIPHVRGFLQQDILYIIYNCSDINSKVFYFRRVIDRVSNEGDFYSNSSTSNPSEDICHSIFSFSKANKLF